MIYAEDIDGNSIHIDDAVKGITYYFRYEDKEYEIIVAHGDKYRKHYKTKRGEDIDVNIIFHKDCQKYLKENKVVEVDNIPGFTLFDWSYVMQCALQIHTVDTSWCYLFEKLALKNGVNMYSRYTPSNWMHIKNLFKSKWVYHN